MTSGARRLSDRLDRALEAAGVTLLVLAAAVAVVQVFCR
jgi:TRAP-type C4-dicarboxylate transport system permease small subunit